MQLVIIAGGFGKRLRPLTLTRPKALIPLVDRPLVLHILDSLPPSCDEVIIAVNYLFEQVRDFFRGRESRIAVRVVEEPTPLGTGGALKNVERYLHGPFAVYNGDIVDTIDFDGLVQTHHKAGGLGRGAASELTHRPAAPPRRRPRQDRAGGGRHCGKPATPGVRGRRVLRRRSTRS